MDIFEVMKGSINSKIKPEQSDIESLNSYLYCRWLLGNQHTMKLATVFNTLHNIPVENQYNSVKSIFCDKIRYIKYLKQPHKKTDMSPELMQALQHRFKINEFKAYEYLQLMDNEELNQLKSTYKIKE